MDPLTVLSLTCNVLQLVETGYKGLALCWRLYKNGEDVKTSDLREMSESLDKGRQRLQSLLQTASSPLTSDENDLFDLCTKCQDTSSKLLDELQKLVLPVKSNVFLVMGKALKSATKAGTIERLNSQLERMGKVLDSRILISTYTLLKQSNLDIRDFYQSLDQRSRELLDAITAGQLQLATLLSDNALACQKAIEREHQTTRNQIEDARTGLSKTVINDGTFTRKRIDSFANHFDNLTLKSKQNDLFKAILQNLEYPEIFSRPDSISDPHRDTCDWIFTHEAFTAWLVNEDQLFWVQGKAGSGKSTLMHFLAEDEDGKVQKGLCQWARNRPVEVLSFYFWESGTELQRSTEGLYRSLLYQLLRRAKKSEDLMEKFLSIGEVTDLGATSRHVTAKLLMKLLPKVVAKSDLCLCIFLDGLDEFGEDEELLDLIDSLRALDRVKICASSRSSSAFEDYFEKTRKLRVHHLTAPAIKKYVSEKLIQDERLGRLVSKDRDTAQSLFVQIVESAEGVFLWVKLVVQDLIRGLRNKDGLATLQRRVERQPREVQGLYEAMWNRIKADHDLYEEEAALYFEMATRESTYELSNSPLVFALAKNDDVRRHCLDAIKDPEIAWLGLNLDKESLLTRIQTCTAGLLEVRSRVIESRWADINDPDFDSADTPKVIVWAAEARVDFIHKTAREFLQSSSTMKSLLTSQDSGELNEQRNTESEILCWGLTYMVKGTDDAGFPAIRDDAASLPWVEIIETLLHRISRQENFDWENHNSPLYHISRLVHSDAPRSEWRQNMPDSTDIVVYILDWGLVDIAQTLIEARNYPRTFFTNLLALYQADEWIGKTLFYYLVAHGADLNQRFRFGSSLIQNPTTTVGLTILNKVIRLFGVDEDELIDTEDYLAVMKLILKHNASCRPRILSLRDTNYPSSVILVFGGTVYDRIAAITAIAESMGEKRCAEVSLLKDLLSDTGFTGAKRICALQRGRTIWPVSEESSVLFFDRAHVLVTGRYYFTPTRDGCVLERSCLNNPGSAWFFDGIMSQEKPFGTMEDAYRHVGWSDEDLEQYWEPLKSPDFPNEEGWLLSPETDPDGPIDDSDSDIVLIDDR